jgi:predicted transposase YdaD
MADKDIISKSLIEQIATCLITKLLKLDIVPDQVELLSTEYYRVEERRADILVRVQSAADHAPGLLHLEIQNNNHPQMPLRMLRYYTDIRLRWPDESLQQYLIYIGRKTLTMPDGIAAFNYRYQVIDMRTIDCTLLLGEDTPDALVLAILCDFKDRPAEDIIEYIIRRLYELTQDNGADFRRYFHMLEVLGNNRDLSEKIQETRQMLTDFNIEELPSYQYVLERGVQKGMQRGMQRGMATGIRQGMQHTAAQLIGKLDDQEIAKICELSLAEVQALHTTSG